MKIKDNIITSYGILWGSKERPDFEGDFFTPESDLWLNVLKNQPMIYAHGQRIPEEKMVVGTWKSMEPDDLGVWMEGELDVHNEYNEFVSQLIGREVIGASSDSTPHLVKRELVDAKKGIHEIKRWPIIAVSLVPNPAEPRLKGSVSFLEKGLPFIKSHYPEDVYLKLAEEEKAGKENEEAEAVRLKLAKARLSLLRGN